ncbi:TonB family protein [Alkalimarinus alittae]|uniref:TonB family protein n=1 Tax=Alkalimarinus alittae TaxID=2961619 RepID=A0ABY6N3E2_9ALTE|nr:TonB family protein [Alkalimarinus alittae]UZE96540.1 TonB family protein [Alkalimarinus alittae]
MSAAVVAAGAVDRLSFTIFLALALHAIIVLGVTFGLEDPKPAPHTMEITLAQYDDGEKPEDADFLAQANQQGSGTVEEVSKISTPVKAKQNDKVIREVEEIQQEAASRPEPIVKKKTLVATESNAKKKAPVVENKKTEKTDPTKQPKKSLLARSLEIASLEAELQRQQKEYSKRPKVTRFNAASAMKAVDAQYMALVKNKIERIGALNFPEEARSKLYGRPRLLIAIRSDGTLRDINVLESSGNNVLDDKALKIVRMAAPFPPFPEEVRKERDELEIIRTLQFKGG